jgi:hypothetical protein
MEMVFDCNMKAFYVSGLTGSNPTRVGTFVYTQTSSIFRPWGKRKKARTKRALKLASIDRLPGAQLALAGFEALVDLVDDVNATATADELVRAVASHQRLQRVADFHLDILD